MQDLSLTLHQSKQQNVPFGCYTKIKGENKNSNIKTLLMPLTSHQCDVQLINSTAHVTLLQYYSNPTDSTLQVDFFFPLAPSTSLIKFQVSIGKTTMKSIIKQKQRTEKQTKDMHNSTSMTNQHVSSDYLNIFSLKLGGVQPQSKIKIELVYLKEVKVRYNVLFYFSLQNMFPQFMNYSTQEQLKYSLKSSTSQKWSEPNIQWKMTICLKTSNKIVFCESSTHNILLHSQNKSCCEKQYSVSRDKPTKNTFTLFYSTENIDKPTCLLSDKEEKKTAIISFIPSFYDIKPEAAFKAIKEERELELQFDNVKGQYIFIIDRSCSMSGRRIERAKEALILFIKSLPRDSYFNIISFGSESYKMFTESVKYNDTNVHSSVFQIKKMQADLGGTHIYALLQEQLMNAKIELYPKQIFLLTDGAVPNTEQVIRMVSRNKNRGKVHTIGIGNDCSQQLIKGCADKSKGLHIFISDSQQPSGKIIQMLYDTISPAISNIQLKIDQNIIESVSPNHEQMQNIFKDEIVTFCLVLKQKITKSIPLTLQYYNPMSCTNERVDIDIFTQHSSGSFVDELVHMKNIHILEETLSCNGNILNFKYSNPCVKDLKEEIIEQSIQNQILSNFTELSCIYQQPSSLQLSNKSIDKEAKPSNLKLTENPFLSPPKFDIKTECFQENQLQKSGSSKCSSNLFSSRKVSIRTMPHILTFSKKIEESSIDSGQFFYRSSNNCNYAQNKKFNHKSSLQNEIEQDSDDQQFFIDEIVEEKVNCQLISPEKEKTQEVAKSELELKERSKINIIELVLEQSSQGQWKNINIIKQIYGKKVFQLIEKQVEPHFFVSCLVLKWIERYFPEKQYKLVIKKTKDFLKRKGIKDEKYLKKYEKQIDC